MRSVAAVTCPGDPSHVVRVGVGVPGKHFELTFDDGQRGAQVMRRVGDESPLAGEGSLEPVEHAG